MRVRVLHENYKLFDNFDEAAEQAHLLLKHHDDELKRKYWLGVVDVTPKARDWRRGSDAEVGRRILDRG